MATRSRLPAGPWLRVVADGELAGLVTNYNADTDHAVQPVNVCGVLGPIAFESMNYTISITIGAYVPSPKKVNEVLRSLGEEAQYSVSDFLPMKEDIEDAQGALVIDVLQLRHLKEDYTLEQFEKVYVASEGSQFQANTLVSQNIRLMAVRKANPDRVANPLFPRRR